MNDCLFSGPLPSEMGRLWNMTRMQLHSNQLTGPIPHNWGRMTNMDLMTLENNKLTGSVPAEVCDLRQEKLRQFIVDCYDERRKLGVQCTLKKCCTLCRDSY
jgi:hypothetical protein